MSIQFLFSSTYGIEICMHELNEFTIEQCLFKFNHHPPFPSWLLLTSNSHRITSKKESRNFISQAFHDAMSREYMSKVSFFLHTNERN